MSEEIPTPTPISGAVKMLARFMGEVTMLPIAAVTSAKGIVRKLRRNKFGRGAENELTTAALKGTATSAAAPKSKHRRYLPIIGAPTPKLSGGEAVRWSAWLGAAHDGCFCSHSIVSKPM
ncbi:MAG: hypothetical protein U1D69_08695, partial [Polynucleobacter sp.]|nr:hypothetical protein [Polynucleobacter sp.]